MDDFMNLFIVSNIFTLMIGIIIGLLVMDIIKFIGKIIKFIGKKIKVKNKVYREDDILEIMNGARGKTPKGKAEGRRLALELIVGALKSKNTKEVKLFTMKERIIWVTKGSWRYIKNISFKKNKIEEVNNMIQTLDPIQHILDKLSHEDCEDLIDFFSELHMSVNLAAVADNNKIDAIINVEKWIESLGTEGTHLKNHIDKIGTVDVFDEIYPIIEKSPSMAETAMVLENTFGYKPVDRPDTDIDEPYKDMALGWLETLEKKEREES